nr:hypothetical protein BaRGS_001348 [Batillaria attramentaria]
MFWAIRDLKDINQSLKRDLEHAKSRRTPTGPEELERQYQQLLKEKEILAAEVVKLRDRLEATSKEMHRHPIPDQGWRQRLWIKNDCTPVTDSSTVTLALSKGQTCGEPTLVDMTYYDHGLTSFQANISCTVYNTLIRSERVDLQRPYKETNGDDSDTATDILLNAEPSTNPGHTRRRHRRSSGSDASLSSLSDCDDPPESLRRRSRSADHKGKRGNPSRYGQTTTLRPAASAERLAGGKTVTLSTAGFRSVTPQPLTTQHNRGAVIQQMQMQAQQQSLASSLTQGLRPFAPRAPADVRPEDVVKFSRQGGKLSQGTVKFVGHLPGRTDVYLGVELYKEEGKHDGTFEGIRYFKW